MSTDASRVDLPVLGFAAAPGSAVALRRTDTSIHISDTSRDQYHLQFVFWYIRALVVPERGPVSA